MDQGELDFIEITPELTIEYPLENIKEEELNELPLQFI